MRLAWILPLLALALATPAPAQSVWGKAPLCDGLPISVRNLVSLPVPGRTDRWTYRFELVSLMDARSVLVVQPSLAIDPVVVGEVVTLRRGSMEATVTLGPGTVFLDPPALQARLRAWCSVTFG